MVADGWRMAAKLMVSRVPGRAEHIRHGSTPIGSRSDDIRCLNDEQKSVQPAVHSKAVTSIDAGTEAVNATSSTSSSDETKAAAIKSGLVTIARTSASRARVLTSREITGIVVGIFCSLHRLKRRQVLYAGFMPDPFGNMAARLPPSTRTDASSGMDDGRAASDRFAKGRGLELRNAKTKERLVGST
jgi:hypothetical protein